MRLPCSLLVVAALLTACGTPPLPAHVTAPLFDGQRYPGAAVPSRASLFALSPAMAEFLRTEVRKYARLHGPQRGLFLALSEGGHFHLEYDSSQTRSAADAFAARAGNCLSLVLLTAALAREMGIQVHYQMVEVPDLWTRTERFLVLNTHVNLSLGEVARAGVASHMGALTIDFQPSEEPRLVRVRTVSEDTVVAMFYNNRAIERMEAGQWQDAHALLQAALAADGTYLNALNSLAVLHLRQGDLTRAEASVRAVLSREPRNQHASANLVHVLERQGRHAEAERVARELPPPPFLDFEEGVRMTELGRWAQAIAAFKRQLRISPEFHGVHLELARAYLQLGQMANAQQHLEIAEGEAPTPALRQRYHAKLQALKRLGLAS